MPPRGPISISREDARLLLQLLQDCDWSRDLVTRLNLAMQSGESSVVTVVIKDDEAEGILDLLEPTNAIRPVIQKALTVMKQG